MRAAKKGRRCFVCGRTPLTKDEIGLNRKLLDPRTERFQCLDCLASWLDVTPEELKEKIAQFKEEGCALF